MSKRTLLSLDDVDSYEHGRCYSIDVEHLGHAIEWTVRKECPECDGAGCLADWDPRVTHRCERCEGTGVSLDYHQWPLSVGALWMVFDEAFDALAVPKLQLTDQERVEVAAHEDGRAVAEGRASRSPLLTDRRAA